MTALTAWLIIASAIGMMICAGLLLAQGRLAMAELFYVAAFASSWYGLVQRRKANRR